MRVAASFRDPVHGFIRSDGLEAALIDSRPLQRLRSIRQLGLAHLVFPGAEHSRFSHALGAMHLAGLVYDALSAEQPDLLDADPRCRERRLVRLAALLHDVGHPPFSHTTEGRFAGGIRHEEMSRRLLDLEDVRAIFDRLGDGIGPQDVQRLLEGPDDPTERLLAQVVAGELDVDKMDYLLRDSLYCGVGYGSFDLDRLLDTILPLLDPRTGEWGLGVSDGGVHALEALVMARYYMFTQVYFNVAVKAFEHHLAAWLEAEDIFWSDRPEAFLELDDISMTARLRASESPHARALAERRRFALAFETQEHLGAEEKARFEAILPTIEERFGIDNLLISNSAKDPHRLPQTRVLVRQFDGSLQPMEEASHFIRHLARIDRYRIYTPPELSEQVAETTRDLLRG